MICVSKCGFRYQKELTGVLKYDSSAKTIITCIFSLLCNKNCPMITSSPKEKAKICQPFSVVTTKSTMFEQKI